MSETNQRNEAGVHPGAQDDPNDTSEPPVTRPDPPDAAGWGEAADDEEHSEMKSSAQNAQEDQP
jgi:hypothetical protein